jgi:hypothetical protein
VPLTITLGEEGARWEGSIQGSGVLAMASHPLDHIQPVGPITSRVERARSLSTEGLPARRASHSALNDFQPMRA